MVKYISGSEECDFLVCQMHLLFLLKSTLLLMVVCFNIVLTLKQQQHLTNLYLWNYWEVHCCGLPIRIWLDTKHCLSFQTAFWLL